MNHLIYSIILLLTLQPLLLSLLLQSCFWTCKLFVKVENINQIFTLKILMTNESKNTIKGKSNLRWPKALMVASLVLCSLPIDLDNTCLVIRRFDNMIWKYGHILYLKMVHERCLRKTLFFYKKCEEHASSQTW